MHKKIVQLGGAECLIEALNDFTIEGNLAAITLDFIATNLGIYLLIFTLLYSSSLLLLLYILFVSYCFIKDSVKGKEEDIAMVLSKYKYNTGSSAFGATMAKIIGYI